MLTALPDTDSSDTKNWRPQLLVLMKLDAGGGMHKPALLHFADQMKTGRGLFEVISVVDGGPERFDAARQSAEQLKKQMLEHHNISGFVKVIVSPSLTQGISTVVQSSGYEEYKSE